MPIIDYRAYADDNPTGDIHLRYHSFSMRERLRKANGTADNHVMLVEDFRFGYYSSSSPMLLDAPRQMDLWLANIAADQSDTARSVKVVRKIKDGLQPFTTSISHAPYPETRQVRNLIHLQTPISADLRPQTTAFDLLEALHPTPAVGGSP